MHQIETYIGPLWIMLKMYWPQSALGLAFIGPIVSLTALRKWGQREYYSSWFRLAVGLTPASLLTVAMVILALTG